jgi:hypothetical protein
MSSQFNRRDFLKQTGAIGAGVTLAELGHSAAALAQESEATTSEPDRKPLKIGFVGVGARGSCLLKILMELPGVEVRALCDIREDRVERAHRWVVEKSRPEPAGYSRGDTDFQRMCQTEDLDLVLTATPWRWHVPVCVAAMKAGKHAATEVPAALTLDQCWQLVETSEKQQRHCTILENYCYFRKAMTVLNMVRQGVFGELLHCEGRTQENWVAENWHFFDSDGTIGWVAEHLAQYNGNPYPTHGFGPMAIWANINRGDRLQTLVSMSSKSRSLANFARESFGAEHPLAQRGYAQGDANVSLIRSASGVTFTLYFGGQSPQPWSPEHKVQGTLGTCIGEMFDYRAGDDGWLQAKVFNQKEFGRWRNYWDYLEQYDHPLWKALGQTANRYRAWDWSGAYDYLMLGQLVRALQDGRKPPLDVYDAATWSAISELAERSVAGGTSAVDFPDFTNGKWKDNAPTDLSDV